nr:unnamed protein product [Digitaria exilis]
MHEAVNYLSQELYSKDVHFLMELVQNAEDNEYPCEVVPSLEFLITSKDITRSGASSTILIFNNERGFSSTNIESICRVGKSTKKGNRHQGYIGQRKLSVREDNSIPESSTVTEIAISIENNFQSRKSMHAESYTLNLSAEESGKMEEECGYYVWRQKFPVKAENKVEKRDKIDEWVITLAFPLGERLSREKKLLPGVYAFLPTEMITDFPFIIQADFLLSSSREAVLFDSPWNKGILECVPTAFMSAFVTLVKSTPDAPAMSLPSMFNFLPVNPSVISLLEPVRSRIKEKVLTEDIVPCESYSLQKIFCKASEVARLKPAFWTILHNAREFGVNLKNLSSHGTYILSSHFDKSTYDSVLKFLEVKNVDPECWNKEFPSSNKIFVQPNTQSALENFSNRSTVTSWLQKYAKAEFVCVYSYGSTVVNSLSNAKTSVISFTHFLYHSDKKSHIDGYQLQQLCRAMPLIDSYGNVVRSRNSIMVPASGSKWVELMGINPWKKDGYIELSAGYKFAGHFAGNYTSEYQLLEFLKAHVQASDVPHINPPSSPLTVDNALLLLEWVQNRKSNGVRLPDQFLASVRKGGWLKTSVGYKPPEESFLSSAKWGRILHNGSSFVDIPMIDQQFYRNKLDIYTDELKLIGVRFEFQEALAYTGSCLLSKSAGRALTRENVYSLLRHIRYLGEEFLSPIQLINSVKYGQWMKSTIGYRQPADCIINDSEWEVASNISNQAFLDVQFYEKEILQYTPELQLLGVIVGFKENYELVIHKFKFSSTAITAQATILILKCIRYVNQCECESEGDGPCRPERRRLTLAPAVNPGARKFGGRFWSLADDLASSSDQEMEVVSPAAMAEGGLGVTASTVAFGAVPASAVGSTTSGTLGASKAGRGEAAGGRQALEGLSPLGMAGTEATVAGGDAAARCAIDGFKFHGQEARSRIPGGGSRGRSGIGLGFCWIDEGEEGSLRGPYGPF